MDPDTREFDFDDASLAENSRVGYPVEYINNAELSGKSQSVPKTVIFLTADAYGVLPPISKLDKNQAMYYFVSGFTSKLAGTEIGITSPVPTFSTCFGEPFLPSILPFMPTCWPRRSKRAAPMSTWSTPAGTAPASA